MSIKTQADPLGFPMAWIDEIQAYIHWYPVSKLQFETFLCDVLDEAFDARWYKEALARNPRVTASAISTANYWQAFMTGVSHEEAQRFARWYGDGYRLPRTSEWCTALRTFRGRAASKAPLPVPATFMNRRFRDLLHVLNEVSFAVCHTWEPSDLAAAMLLDRGVLEWAVDSSGGDHAYGCGTPHPGFFPALKEPGTPISPTSHDRLNCWPFGFRLVYDPHLS